MHVIIFFDTLLCVPPVSFWSIRRISRAVHSVGFSVFQFRRCC